jgi:long-chain acyl-CoA synthetase
MVVDGCTLPELLELDPEAIAIDDLSARRTWSELDDRVARLRALFADAGLAAGDHVAMVMDNRVEFVELTLAALTSGIWLTPVNWHGTTDDVAYVVDDCGARLVFTTPENAAMARDASGGRQVLVAGTELDDRLDALAPARLDPAGVPGANMFYTSGTTGRPKGVRRGRQRDLATQLAALRKAGAVLGLDGGGPHLVTGPLYHAAPLGFAVMDLLQGASMIVMPSFDPTRTLTLIAEHRVRNTHLVPTMFVRLLRLDDAECEAFDGASLSTVLHGAAPIAPSVKRAMIEWWGPVLVEYWGASEGGVVTLVGSEEWLTRPGTVGRPTASHEVFAGADDGTRLPPGEEGLLWCRNTATDVVFEYHNDEEKTAGVTRGPGTYTIGDVGRVDDDGYVYLADRASNMIISGGVNIYPAEIEAVLVEHPAVSDAAVFGIPDDEWGESVRAAIELTTGFDPTAAVEEDILRHTRARLARFKVPRSIEFHEQLPRAPTGKLATRVLRDPHWRDRDRAI